ncbi:glycosyltransferase family 2 protein [Limibaculum sp. FT325]|uniref:glycosyltransferase family 2 protein n=1 Tax=Thermohalobaculum sediminis TaxID=2939436 RepID=UPI0020C01879|nr:glycosyltransferase family A protein [Limibaculum sediminis]MCL5776862.1 glycosyltransferase family 2 protein [Limibaculum sediminis]
MNSPFFSIIIPSYNRLPLLRECLESVRAQTFRDFELIVVDDGSTDGTFEFLASEVPRARIARQANAGPSAARNSGASIASGRYLAFLDCDDLWPPWALETYASAVGDKGDIAMLFGRYVDFHCRQSLEAYTQKPPIIDYWPCYFDAAGFGYYGGSGVIVISRRAFLSSGGFREERVNAEDHDLVLRLGEVGGFGQVLSPVTLFRRIHEGNQIAIHKMSTTGVRRLVESELSGGFPGGAERAAQRRSIICQHVRPVVISATRTGHLSEAWWLYTKTAQWHMRQLKLSFLAGAGAMIGLASLRMKLLG